MFSTNVFVLPRTKGSKYHKWSILFFTFCLFLFWQGPLWAQTIAPQRASASAAWNVSLATHDHSFIAELGNTAESLPTSVLVPPNWYWTMSFLIPGLSQMLMDEPVHGLIFFIGFVASIALVPVTVSVFTTHNQPEGADSSVANGISWGLAAVTIGFYLGNLIDAYFLNQDKLKASSAAEILAGVTPESGLRVGFHNRGVVSLDYQLTRF